MEVVMARICYTKGLSSECPSDITNFKMTSVPSRDLITQLELSKVVKKYLQYGATTNYYPSKFAKV
jgi:hypothetical protein